LSGTVHVFFPVYNEGKSAGSLVRRVDAEGRRLGRPFHILVVDDGSKDNSVEEVRAAADGVPLTLVEHGTNRGLRAALETGIHWLVENGADGDVAVFMDGDDTHDPKHVRDMLARIDEGADVVIASRFRPGATVTGVPRYRQLLSFGANVWGMAFFHIRGVRDYACGYRAIRMSSLEALAARYRGRLFELDGFGFICAVEMLVKLGDVARRFAEVPIELRYDRKESASKMDAVRTVLGYFALFRHRLKTRQERQDAAVAGR
jgi:dolichol-phosphate mannosyltransferase